MPSFRCYFLDAEDHIGARVEIEASALTEAINRALELFREGQPRYRSVEIWQGAVQVYPEQREKRATGESAA